MWASITTIPTRVDETLFGTIATLVDQKYPVEVVIVTLPRVNMRGIEVTIRYTDTELQERLDEIASAARQDDENRTHIVLVRPSYDWGPIMKYIGVLEYVKTRTDLSWTDIARKMVFVGDDDQMYSSNRILYLYKRHTRYCQKNGLSVHDVVCTQKYNGISEVRVVQGYAGVMLTIQSIYDANVYLMDHMIRTRRKQLELCCALNDDVLMAAALLNTGKRIHTHSHRNTFNFRTGSPTGGSDALNMNPKKFVYMRQCNFIHGWSRTSSLVFMYICIFSAFALVLTAIACGFVLVAAGSTPARV
jgi:hypothetical protein